MLVGLIDKHVFRLYLDVVTLSQHMVQLSFV